jgi:predicted enzyme related to lactoylglutathione lyase
MLCQDFHRAAHTNRKSASPHKLDEYTSAIPWFEIPASDIQKVIDRIEPAGGKLIKEKTKIPAGYNAVFRDAEGNTLAIDSDQ